MKVLAKIFNVIAKIIISVIVAVGISTLLLIAYGIYVMLGIIT